MHLLDLEEGTVTAMDSLLETLSPRTTDQRQDYRPAHEDRKRIEAIEQRDTHHGVRLWHALSHSLTHQAPTNSSDSFPRHSRASMAPSTGFVDTSPPRTHRFEHCSTTSVTVRSTPIS